MLDPNIDIRLRHQILKYHISDVMTDAERARLLELPEGCRIRERAKIICPEKLKMGKNVYIGEGAVLDAQGGLTIGDNTQIGTNTLIWSHSSHLQAILGETSSPTKTGIAYKETKIGMNCFIAGPSVVGPGVTIGDRVVVAPLSFVDHDVSDDEVVSAPAELKNLARKVKRLEELLDTLKGELAEACKGRDGG
jgi:acetyltransferase-like isoleucine patch superfamily enzyme